LHFDFANLAHQLGAFETAKAHYLLAKEHDLLRFRAPERINETIRDLATKYKNVTLVDAHSALVQRSPNGIIGSNFMLEHLHPNLTGYYVISNSFYEAFARSQLVKNFKKVSIDLAWQQRLVLPAEEYNGFASIVKLKSDYPFVDTPQTPKLPRPADWQQQLGKQLYEKRIDWLTMMQKSLERYRASNQLDKAYKTLQILADALPHNGLYNLQTAEIMFKEKRFTESLHYYRRAKLAGAIGPEIDSNISFLERKFTKQALQKIKS
jgi:tetratricopeptide (TPR) repeat protein